MWLYLRKVTVGFFFVHAIGKFVLDPAASGIIKQKFIIIEAAASGNRHIQTVQMGIKILAVFNAYLKGDRPSSFIVLVDHPIIAGLNVGRYDQCIAWRIDKANADMRRPISIAFVIGGVPRR